jgi:hypothetical protein
MTNKNNDEFKCETVDEAMQAAFTGAVRGLNSQGWAQCVPPHQKSCRWNLGKPGVHCAVGWLIPWEKQKDVNYQAQHAMSALDTHRLHPELARWAGIQRFRDFVVTMQNIHDVITTPGDRRDRFHTLGTINQLRWPSDVPTTDVFTTEAVCPPSP